MVNAFPHNLLKRAIKFNQCAPPDGSIIPPTKLKVTLSPEVPVAGQMNKVTISGKFTEDITENTELVVAFIDSNRDPIDEPTKLPACTGSGCSIKVGEQYTQTVEIQTPDSIPHSTDMFIVIGNSKTDVIGCANAEL
ncbi:15234_t:CDS:1 [Funneliformis mosseae]|uniref:Phosphatidylglycerol/phosphatidylinositol transfer protein n=1 Tax=Funneliformis mosseae TaxID=27381 RepID=A0A9N8ZCR6_FUNMO|nr:15234_t:CDS:1 [Funneliformis mosseae]